MIVAWEQFLDWLARFSPRHRLVERELHWAKAERNAAENVLREVKRLVGARKATERELAFVDVCTAFELWEIQKRRFAEGKDGGRSLLRLVDKAEQGK